MEKQFSKNELKSSIDDNMADIKEQQRKASTLSKPPFPLEVFPNFIQHVITELNHTNYFPIDFMGLGVLVATATAIGNSRQIKLKNNWHEIPSLFAVLVGDSSSKKTPSFKDFALQPILKKQGAAKEEYKSALFEWEERKKAAEENKEDFKEPPPIMKEYYVSDMTFECLVPIHINNPRSILAYKDELVSWFRTFNQYRKGADQQGWLSIYSGSPLKVNRRSEKEPLILERPSISVIGGIQTGLLCELAGENRDKDGFMFRLLYAFADPIEKEEWNDNEIDMGLIKEYECVIEHIYKIPYADESDCVILSFSDAAKALWVKFFNKIKVEESKAKKKNDEVKLSMLGKLIQQTARLALILEMLFYGCNESGGHEISEKAMKGAIALANYFKFTGEYAYQLAKDTEPETTKHSSSYKINWVEIFGTDQELKNQEIITRLVKKHGMSEPTANRCIKNDLVKVKYGIYSPIIT